MFKCSIWRWAYTGFGVSDKALEKTCLTLELLLIRLLYLKHVYPYQYSSSQINLYAYANTNKDNYHTSLQSASNKAKGNRQKSYIFASIYNEIKCLHAATEIFWSDKNKKVVNQVYEYFNNIHDLHTIEPLIVFNKYSKQVQSFLFDGFS